MSDNYNALDMLSMSRKFIKLAELSAEQICQNHNDDSSDWSTESLSIPILFNFYHGLELALKGFIVAQDVDYNETTHCFSSLIKKGQELYKEHNFLCIARFFTVDLSENSYLQAFLDENQIKINDWYQSLKYPQGKVEKKLKNFHHFNIKYDVSKEFWEDIKNACSDIDKELLGLYNKLDDRNAYEKFNKKALSSLKDMATTKMTKTQKETP
ncbi:hypothetical protein ACFBZI_09175 [Moraxella sp. ZJ142]|uniref:hypothetical protein n=1 Tax=Moraxella marmotae TaxID=3344520 RepID=UPI0035D4F1A5